MIYDFAHYRLRSVQMSAHFTDSERTGHGQMLENRARGGRQHGTLAITPMKPKIQFGEEFAKSSSRGSCRRFAHLSTSTVSATHRQSRWITGKKALLMPGGTRLRERRAARLSRAAAAAREGVSAAVRRQNRADACRPMLPIPRNRRSL